MVVHQTIFFMLLLYPLIDFMFLNFKEKRLYIVQQALRGIALIMFLGVHFNKPIAQIWQLLGSYYIVYQYIEIFIIGYICSKYLLFEKVAKIMEKHEKISHILCAICLIACVFIRSYFCRSASDIKLDALIIAPFIYCIAYFVDHIPNLKRCLQYFGGYSTYMWLVHIFFIYRFGNFLVTFSHISILMYISAIIVSVLSAKVLCKMEKIIYNRFTVC